ALVGLPGRRKEVENIAQRPDRVSELLAKRDTTKSGLTTTTIPVRRDLGSQLRAGEAIAAAAAAIPPAAAVAAAPVAPEAAEQEQRKPQRLGTVSTVSAELPLR